MTDNDRQLLLELRRMANACGLFCAGVIENDLSRDDQLALSDWLTDIAGRIRERALSTPVVIEVPSADATAEAQVKAALPSGASLQTPSSPHRRTGEAR